MLVTDVMLIHMRPISPIKIIAIKMVVVKMSLYVFWVWWWIW